jgi:hypothetical protein
VKKQKMNTKIFVVGMVLFVLVASMGAALAHNEGDSGVAYPGVPYISTISGGERVGNTTTLEAVTIGLEGFDHFAAYAGSPYVSPYMY